MTSNYVLGGGDGYTMLEEGATNHVIGDLDTDVIKRVGSQTVADSRYAVTRQYPDSSRQ